MSIIAPNWARPTIDNFLSKQTMPNSVRLDLPAAQAAQTFGTIAEQFETFRATDNTAVDLDPAPNSVKVTLEGTNAFSQVAFEGDSNNGVLMGGVYAEGSNEPSSLFYEKFTPTSRDVVILNPKGDGVNSLGIHVEQNGGFILRPQV